MSICSSILFVIYYGRACCVCSEWKAWCVLSFLLFQTYLFYSFFSISPFPLIYCLLYLFSPYLWWINPQSTLLNPNPTTETTPLFLKSCNFEYIHYIKFKNRNISMSDCCLLKWITFKDMFLDLIRGLIFVSIKNILHISNPNHEALIYMLHASSPWIRCL